MNLSFSVVYTLLCHSGDKIARCRGAVFGLPDKNFFGLDRKEPRDSGLFMDLDFSCFRVSVCVNRPPRPRGERAEKGADLLIPQQEGDILGGHIGVGKVGLRQQLPRVVELFLKLVSSSCSPASSPRRRRYIRRWAAAPSGRCGRGRHSCRPFPSSTGGASAPARRIPTSTRCG